MLDYKGLKARQRQIRNGFPESLSLRVHRALSWLDRAERETEDQDARLFSCGYRLTPPMLMKFLIAR